MLIFFGTLKYMHRNQFELYQFARALSDWKITVGEGIKQRRDCKTKISNRPCPLQEGSVECGYFILGFMREIVSNGINALERKEFFTSNDLDLIRDEWCGHVMEFVNYDM